MNCQDFNNILAELADYKPMDATVRDASVSHAALCPNCAANLAAARNVSNYLLQAARAESEEAPALIKQNLLKAFAEVQSPKSKVQSQKEDTSADVGRWTLDIGRARWRLFAAVAAIAAVILLAVIVPMLRNSLAPVSQSPDKLAEANSSSSPSQAKDIAGVNSTVAKENVLEDLGDVSAATSVKKLRSPKRRKIVSRSNRYESVTRNNNEYLPLTYLTAGTAMESGTVVRVELSRTALASLGFSTSADSSSDSVKAEVILGDDGVARAIRLVE